MEGALHFRVEHPGPRRRSGAGGEPRHVSLDRDAQLLLTALRSLRERDGAAGLEREQSALDRMLAADEPVVERELGRPERQERRAAEQLQPASAAHPACANSATGKGIDRLPVGDAEGAGAGLGCLDDGLRHEHALPRLEAARLEHALRCLPTGHAAAKGSCAS